jgi:hypothetical protein
MWPVNWNMWFVYLTFTMFGPRISRGLLRLLSVSGDESHADRSQSHRTSPLADRDRFATRPIKGEVLGLWVAAVSVRLRSSRGRPLRGRPESIFVAQIPGHLRPREAIFTAGDPKGSALFLIYTHQTHEVRAHEADAPTRVKTR